MDQRLEVYLFDRLAGCLEQDSSGQLRFTYAPSWLEDPPAALSQSLPLQKEPFDHRSCRGFFASILPEGEPSLADCFKLVKQCSSLPVIDLN